MTRYFLAPRSGEKSHQNYLSTIKYGVPFSRIESHLTDEGKKILSKQEVIYSWANREGRKAPWERMNVGDVVIFYDHGDFVMAGDVIYKQHSPGLALAMWPLDEHGQPWEYTYFINNLRYFKIPLKHFNLVSGYKLHAVMGFQEIAEANKKIILTHYKNFDELFEAFPDHDSISIPKPNEHVHVNIQKQVAPELSQKTITSYVPPVTPEGTKRKKKSGYVDFDELNRNRAKIGSTGEEIVLRYERNFLISKGRKDLADKVHQTSLHDTYAGYDIDSFDEQGNKLKIEVKSTVIEQPENFSFNISKNEKAVAEHSDNYFIYLVYGVNLEKPKIHVIKNPFKVNDHLTIEPAGFIVRGKFSA